MRKSLSVLLIVCLVVSGLFAGGNSEQKPAQTAKVDTVNVIYHPTIGGSTAIATAINQGYFKDENLDVRLQMYTSGPPEIAAMNELRSAYMAKNPLVKVTANYGSSGSLQQQIEQGAPADLFFSAGLKQMKALQDKQLMDNDTVKPILENKLVLIIPKNGAAVTMMDDLTKDSFGKIAVGDPKSVPAGQYAQETLKNLGLDGKVKAKLVFAKDVREVLSWVETGNAQVGFVYETDALISKNVTISFTTPEGSHGRQL